MRISKDWCNHFTGLNNKQCAAGVDYESVKLPHDPLPIPINQPGGPRQVIVSYPCIAKYNPGGATCKKCEYPTTEQVAASDADRKRSTDLMIRGLSDCCEAPIDKSHVIKKGQNKGHGPRYCSQCGRCVLIV